MAGLCCRERLYGTGHSPLDMNALTSRPGRLFRYFSRYLRLMFSISAENRIECHGVWWSPRHQAGQHVMSAMTRC